MFGVTSGSWALQSLSGCPENVRTVRDQAAEVQSNPRQVSRGLLCCAFGRSRPPLRASVAAYAHILESGGARRFRIQQIAAVDDNWTLHEFLQALQVESAVLFPVGQDKQRLSSTCRLVD